jgi:hypothetical protein
MQSLIGLLRVEPDPVSVLLRGDVIECRSAVHPDFKHDTTAHVQRPGAILRFPNGAMSVHATSHPQTAGRVSATSGDAAAEIIMGKRGRNGDAATRCSS